MNQGQGQRPQGRPAPPQGAALQRQQQEQALAGQQSKTVSDMLTKYRAEFTKVIPKHLNPERIMRVAQAAIGRDRKLLACTPASLLRGVMQSAILGLEVGVMGECYLVPFKNEGILEATFIPGYQGLIKLAIQSRAVAAVQVGAVYPGDDFDYGLGSEPFVRHRPSLKAKDPQTLVAVYCVCKLSSGEFQATIMGKEEVDLIRSRSRAKDSGPWVTDYEPMAIKTAIRRALKYVPKTPMLAAALETEDRKESGAGVDDLFPDLDGVKLPGDDAADVTPGRKSTEQEAAEVLGGGKQGAPQQQGGTATDAAGLDREFEQSQGREPGSDG